MLHNNSAVSGDVGMEEAAHLHRNGSRYEGVRSGMVSERGRLSKDEPGAFEGASAARANPPLPFPNGGDFLLFPATFAGV